MKYVIKLVGKAQSRPGRILNHIKDLGLYPICNVKTLVRFKQGNCVGSSLFP